MFYTHYERRNVIKALVQVLDDSVYNNYLSAIRRDQSGVKF